jgi:hypothetical protein
MIRLKQVRLVNWYGFGQITVPVGLFTLIAGKNGNGKSVLLDAIKYALYGDTVFNKSTENKGSRTISSYTRGLLDATAGTYMRPADKVPNVYTHIVLEMEEAELKKVFILGTSIDTDSGNGFRTHRYIIENKTLDNISHTYESGGQVIPYSTSGLQKAFGLKMMDVKEGVLRFMQRTGLRLNEQQLASFRRKLRSIMSYDPDARIDQFIRESVLEDKKVDFSKLVEAKNNIDRLNINFSAINNEINELQEILKLFDLIQETGNVIFTDDVKIAYKRFMDYKEDIKKIKENMDIASSQIVEYKKKLKEASVQERELHSAYNRAKENLDSMDCSKAINEAVQALENAKDEKEKLLDEKNSLDRFQTRVSELLAWFYNEKVDVAEKNILSSLLLDNFTAVQKKNSVNKLFQEVKNYRDKIISGLTRINDFINENYKQQVKWQRIIDECNVKKTTFSEVPDYVALKNEINKEFEKRGIKQEACFACEYVIGLTDEAWRDVIESYLGMRRYTILVGPGYYDIADYVLNNSKNKYAHLFNTKLLMKKKIIPEKDSVVNFIKVKNPVAKQYFNYQLGRFHAVTKDQVKNYENAMSEEGRISVAMDSYFLRFDKTRFYCLGQETIEINRINAAKNLEVLNVSCIEASQKLESENEKKLYLEKTMEFFGDYNFDAFKMYERVLSDYLEKQEDLKRLEEAQKNNFEFMELSGQVSKLKQDIEDVIREQDIIRDNMSKTKTEYDINKIKLSEKQESIIKAENILKDYQIKNNVIYKNAIEDYKKHIANGPGSDGGRLQDRAYAEALLKETSEKLTKAQASYNAVRPVSGQLPMSAQSRPEYETRKSRIWMDDLQEIQQKLKEQTKRYEEIFKNEFVLTVLKSCEAARDDLKLINAELARLKFKSRYEFDVKYVKDGSDYEKILEYAKYLKEREELGTTSGQMTFDTLVSYTDDKGKELEKDMHEIINRIVGSNDKDQIGNYADYRNYMTYEILLTNDVLTKAKLSKQSGYNSGAEVQIPYMLVLLSALLMVYNEKVSSTRLVFIDEPFAKMDPVNIKIMLGFMREQNLQMIFCAPDKIELIGSECEVVLPVIRTQADLMEIGTFDMQKGGL